MKNKVILSLILVVFVLFCGICVYRQIHFQKFQKEMFASGLFPTDIRIRESGLNLTGDSLVLHQVSSPSYPELFVRRVQILDEDTVFKLSFQGIQGSLVKYYQETEPYEFKHQLLAYNPLKELLLRPLISLAILEGEMTGVDVFFKASVTAPNQITVKLEIFKGYERKARFVSKFTPYSKERVLKQLQSKRISFVVDYLSSDWKEKLDNYCLSKDIPFFIENTTCAFSF